MIATENRFWALAIHFQYKDKRLNKQADGRKIFNFNICHADKMRGF